MILEFVTKQNRGTANAIMEDCLLADMGIYQSKDERSIKEAEEIFR